jgi:hypothetical protein
MEPRQILKAFDIKGYKSLLVMYASTPNQMKLSQKAN